MQPTVSLISLWTLNEKAAMSWWPDPEMSCVLCSRQKFCSKVLNCKYQICKQILMNARISNVNGGDKSLVRETKRKVGNTVSWCLDFSERRPFSLGLLLLGRCWFSLLAGIFFKELYCKVAKLWPSCCGRVHDYLYSWLNSWLKSTSPHIEQMLKSCKKMFFEQKCLGSPDCSCGHPLVQWLDSDDPHIHAVKSNNVNK